MVKVQSYCVKCRSKQDVKNPKKVVLKNGSKATSGTCAKCGTKVFKLGG